MMSASNVSLCLLACFLSFTVSTEITVKPGDDVTLQCQSPRGAAITLLEWSRPDLETDGYVFFFRDSRSYEHYQHPSFRGRVQLRDPEMKDGDVSVILKNVNINDAGTYECRVLAGSTGRELINTINLKVEDSGDTAGDISAGGHKDEGEKNGGHNDENMQRCFRVIVGLSVTFLLLVL
ncbi:coxsackievirus and adenovirus receptor homolog [Thunnus maccoyii]|uniref:coxsackievirus and adenovirus receptor homolog n=1 Tax=Thunnus maccoyii TaxID=8240 RepID=UPI001C4C1863|nr:coxsackievirus and adenovirus receptor homolog [Thunnus maccoyii]